MSIYTSRISNYTCVYIYIHTYIHIYIYIYIYIHIIASYIGMPFPTGLVMSKYMPTWVASHLDGLPPMWNLLNISIVGGYKSKDFLRHQITRFRWGIVFFSFWPINMPPRHHAWQTAALAFASKGPIASASHKHVHWQPLQHSVSPTRTRPWRCSFVILSFCSLTMNINELCSCWRLTVGVSENQKVTTDFSASVDQGPSLTAGDLLVRLQRGKSHGAKRMPFLSVGKWQTIGVGRGAAGEEVTVPVNSL